MKTFTFSFLFLIFNAVISHAQLEWEHTSGPFGSFASSIYSNDKFAFIPKNDFLYRSDDGVHWEKLEHEGSPFMAINKDTILHPIYDEDQDKLRLQISTDNGGTWMVLDLPALITASWNIAMCGSGIYWAQTSKNLLFKSTDLGMTWDTIFHPINYGYDLAVLDGKLYANGSTQLWRIDQEGETWEEIITPVHSLPHQYIDDFIVKDSNIMLTTEDYIFYSHDDGLSWTQLSMYSRNANDKLTIAGGYVYAKMFDVLQRTNDFGIHWDTLLYNDEYPSLIIQTGLGDIFLSTTYNKGVFRWDESVNNLVESNEGLSKGFIYDLSYGEDKIWAACGNGLFAYDIPSKKWGDKMDLPLPVWQYETVSANDDGWVITAPSYGDSLYFSEDQGLNWSIIHTDFYIDRLQLLGDHLFAFSDFGLYRSLDKGVNWDPVHVGFTDDNFVLYKGNYYVAGDNKIYLTSDLGITWNSITITIDIIKLYSDGDRFYGISADTSDSIDLYISDDAVNWSYAGKGFPDIDYFEFINYKTPAIFFRDVDHYYAFLGSDGHFISPVDQIEWSPLETTQTGEDYLIHDNVVYLGDEGMYTSAILNPFITGTKDQAINSKKSFSISPIPANEYINVAFESDPFSQHTLQIFSSDGILVKSINISDTKNTLTVGVNDLPVGLYFIAFKGEALRDMKSFIIQR